MKASSESGLWAMRTVVVVCVLMAQEAIRIEDARALGKASEIVPSGGRFARTPAGAKQQVFLYQRFLLMARPLY